MWVHRVTIKTIVDLQKNRPERELADCIYEIIAAWRLYEAIELWLHTGEFDKARAIVAKVRHDKFTDTDMLLNIQARIGSTHRQQDPFTDTCVAAHQQWRDWQKLQQDDLPEEQLERIVARHAHYRECQPELTTLPKEPA
jgi:hypothetical protein